MTNRAEHWLSRKNPFRSWTELDAAERVTDSPYDNESDETPPFELRRERVLARPFLGTRTLVGMRPPCPNTRGQGEINAERLAIALGRIRP